jgi:hypothetical protein
MPAPRLKDGQMTIQIPDTCLLGDRSYVIAAVDGAPLFDPASIGLKPHAVSSACWRGHVCTYAVAHDAFQLATLQISLYEVIKAGRKRTFIDQQGPPINGVLPVVSSDRHAWFNNIYTQLGLDVPFTGGLLLADGFIDELADRLPFRPAWKYSTVVEVVCDAGRVRTIRDVSTEMEAIRDVVRQHPTKPGSAASHPELAWIDSTSLRGYNM